MAITDEERREVARWAAACAERVLPLFEAVAPGDGRPRAAIAIAREFANGAPRSRSLSRIALAAHRAGAEVGDPAALAAARSASLAAAAANIHAEETTGTLGHILGPCASAALARETADVDPSAAAGELADAVAVASPAIRALLARIPASGPGGRRVDALLHELDLGLRR